MKVVIGLNYEKKYDIKNMILYNKGKKYEGVILWKTLID